MLQLIAVSYEEDAILQQVPVETSREVFCSVSSIGFTEWNEVGKRGMRPQWKAEVFPYDYQGETLVEYQGARYTVYRTYQAKEDALELYLEARSGDAQ